MEWEPKSERHKDKRQLTLEEAVADAWLHLVCGTEVNVYNELPRQRGMLALPRLVGWAGDGADRYAVAIVPGEYVRWMLSRKRGFSWAEGYFRELCRGLVESGGRPRVVVWDLEEPVPEDLVARLAERVDQPIEVVGPQQRRRVLRDLVERAEPGLDTRGSWLLESWKLLRWSERE